MPSSEIKISKKGKLDEIDAILEDAEDGNRTGKNEPNLGSFDIGLDNEVGLLKLGSSSDTSNNANILGPSPVNRISDGFDDSPMLPPSEDSADPTVGGI